MIPGIMVTEAGMTHGTQGGTEVGMTHGIMVMPDGTGLITVVGMEGGTIRGTGVGDTPGMAGPMLLIAAEIHAD